MSKSNATSLITNSTCIITGGAGFIGSHLVDALADPKNNNTLIIIDNLSTGNIQNIAHHFNPEDLQHLSAKTHHKTSTNSDFLSSVESSQDLSNYTYSSTQKKLTFFSVDIRSKELIEHIFKTTQPDYVFHFAAMISVPESIQNPNLAHTVNVDGIFNLLWAAKTSGNIKSFIFSSSCAVYGDPDCSFLPLKENTPLKPLSPYASSKMIGEQYCTLFSEIYGIPCVVLRYFNVYGPRQDPHSPYAAVIPLFIDLALQNKPLPIYGDGQQTRDFIYVSDVVSANIFAATLPESDTNESPYIYNVGTGKKIQISHLATFILKHTGKSLDHITYLEKRKGDIIDSYADISLIKKKGYHTKYDISDGLQELVSTTKNSQ